MTATVDEVIHDLQGRRTALQLEIQALDATLRQLAVYKKTPTRQEHDAARRKHEPLPLRAQRQAAGIKLKQLAEAMGVSHGYLSQVESGSRKASPAVINRMRVHLEDLIESTHPNGRGEPHEETA